MTYKLYKAGLNKNVDAVMTTDGTKSFLFDENNPDYQEYLKWLAEGNTPEPASE